MSGYFSKSGRSLEIIMAEGPSVYIECSTGQSDDGTHAPYPCPSNYDGWRAPLKQNDTAQQRATNDEPSTESATGALAAVWTNIEGYAPMENCHTEDGQEVGWIRPRDLKKTTPESKWGTATDWPGEWQAIPHRYDDEGQPIDWEHSTYQPSYAAAKEWIERGWTNSVICKPEGLDITDISDTKQTK